MSRARMSRLNIAGLEAHAARAAAVDRAHSSIDTAPWYLESSSAARSPPRQQLDRLALQRLGKILEPLDGDSRAAVLVGLDGARRHADRLGELALREAARLAGRGQARADTPIDGALSLHGATSCPQIFCRRLATIAYNNEQARTIATGNEHMPGNLTKLALRGK